MYISMFHPVTPTASVLQLGDISVMKYFSFEFLMFMSHIWVKIGKVMILTKKLPNFATSSCCDRKLPFFHTVKPPF